MFQSEYEVIVIGAGHAGLSASFYLKQKNVSHLVLEKDRIGETWRTQRWDSFALNTPNDMNILPGDTCRGMPDEFPLAQDLVRQFEVYVNKFDLPVIEYATVKEVSRSVQRNAFEIVYVHDEIQKTLYAKQLVIASGSQNVTSFPAIASTIDPSITQLHGGQYKNADQLPAGGVLVVGSAQTGCQIAEDLLDAGRDVYLATSRVARIPRRYRGRDVMYWFLEAGMFNITPDMVTDPAMFEMRAPQVSGTGQYGQTVSLQSLHRKGSVILGKLSGAAGHMLTFELNAREHVLFGDQYAEQLKALLEQYILNNGIEAGPKDPDTADEPDTMCDCASSITQLDLHAENIKSIIWCNGFGGDFSYIKLSVLNENGSPIHKNGISPIPGLYFLGLYWLRKRKSGIIHGITEDADFIVQAILKNIPGQCAP